MLGLSEENVRELHFLRFFVLSWERSCYVAAVKFWFPMKWDKTIKYSDN